MKVKEYLRYDKSKTIDSLNCPKIIIDKKCRMLYFHLKDGAGMIIPKAKEEYKDFSDVEDTCAWLNRN